MAGNKRGRRTNEERARIAEIKAKNERILNELAEQAMREKAVMEKLWEKGKEVDMVTDNFLEITKYEKLTRGIQGVRIAEGKGDKIKTEIKIKKEE
jgi:uncharacterized Zn finger protein (UPF0148 family)